MCKEGWRGDHCNDNIDECLMEPCEGPNESCVDTPGSYQCVCRDGMARNHEGKCGKYQILERAHCLMDNGFINYHSMKECTTS